MAKNKSTSQVRPDRNRGGNKSKNPIPAVAAPMLHPEALLDAIEEERARLMNAEAVLHCVVIALDENPGCGTDGPYFQGVIGIARDLLTTAINQLDPDKLDSILESAARDADVEYGDEIDAAVGRKGEVKEIAPEYVH